MRNLNYMLKCISLCALILTCSALAHAQQRTFVSGTGSDANNCLRPTPCRSFQRAHDVVVAGGEVVALDSAGYASFTITKSVTVSGEGIRAAVTATGATIGITINAPGATVILRELTVTGLNGTGRNGIFVQAAAAVYIERCVVTEFDRDGIEYNTNGRLFITDTVVRDNNEDGLAVNSAAAGGTARINIDQSRFEGNSVNGIDLDDGNIEASITNSILSENSADGLAVDSATGVGRVNVAHTTAANNGQNGFCVAFGTANQLNIEYSVARGNGLSGMVVDNAGDTIRVSNSVSTNNATGFRNTVGTFESRQNNTVRGNTTDTSGAITNITGT